MSDRTVSPELLLQAYAAGVFPMAEARDDDGLFWIDPDARGILPLKSFHIPKKLVSSVRRDTFEVRVDTAFREVIRACAAPARARETTWISERIEALYAELHERGFAHSVECWQDGSLVGGLYGVRLRGAFFGESMFHRATGASKVALVHLVARLKAGGFALLDTQFVTDHLKQFGAIEIPRGEYKARLRDSLLLEDADFYRLPASSPGSVALQAITQTS